MNPFNDRIYLLLTFSTKELIEYYLQTVGVIFILGAYNLIGVVIGTPIILEYYSLLFALVLVTLMFLYLKLQALPIDWELLAITEELLTEQALNPIPEEKPELLMPDDLMPEEEEEEEEEIRIAPANEEVQMMEPDDGEFDFTDKLMAVYDTGTPKQLSNVAVKGIEQKVHRMNIR